MPDTPPLEIHVVSHTHWDREWYHPAGRFRQRLVALIDELVDDPPRPGESFLLDGQAIVLDDYLAVRSERRRELAKLLREKRLEAGPWYVLPDELIPSGEALVRNLLAGRGALREHGAEPPPVLYCADSFGHPAALPLLASQFGLSLVILWRGYGWRRWPSGDTVRWRAADGTTVLVFHLPPSGYEFGASLPVDEHAASARWTSMRAVLARRSTLGVLLVQNGADHHARQRQQREAIDTLYHVARPLRLVRSSLARFAAILGGRAVARELPVIEGELRDSYGYTWTLQGTFSSRAAQKRRNASAERLLLRDSEPWAALAARAGGADRGAILRAAWRELLACHPHDTLCGCSVDAVARAMDARLAEVMVQGRGIREDALLDVLGHNPSEAREQRDKWTHAVVVRNAAARPRSGVAELTVATFVGDIPVGPGSAKRASGPDGASARAPASRKKEHGALGATGDTGVLFDGDRPLVTQPLRDKTGVELTESPLHYPDADKVRLTRMLAWVDDVAGYGTRSLHTEVGAGEGEVPNVGTLPSQVVPAASGERHIENGLLRVEWNARGEVRVQGTDGRRISRLIRLEDQDDRGDLYTPSPRGALRVAKFIDARITRRGPLRASVTTMWRVADDPPVRVRLSLDAGTQWIRVRIDGTNNRPDHRLRLVIGTDVDSGEAWADAAFGPVRRTPLIVPVEDTAAERPPPTAPLQRYVSLFAGEVGATLISDGLAEYEARDDGTVAVTLLRAVGELSRSDLPERPGHAGWPARVPGAQAAGPFRAMFALLPHGARSAATLDEIERAADDVLLPLRGRSLRSALEIHRPTRGVELSGEGLVFSACKMSETDEWIVLRCVNLTGERSAGEWRLGWTPSAVRQSRLDETPGAALTSDASVVRFAAEPHAVVTILVR